MKRSITLIILLLALIFSSTTPVSAARKDTLMILDQLTLLKDAIQALDAKVNKNIEDLSKRLAVLEEKIGAISRASADSGQDRESLKLSLQFIKEEINELKNGINKVNDRLMNMPVPAAAAAQDGSASEETPTQAPAQSAENTYYTAYSDYIKKNYQLAVEGFKQFIDMFPEHNLADNSLYWIGECYYSQKKYQDAVDTFTRLITNYSDGDKIPDAILKKGYALIEMGQQPEGIDVLKELISRFPLSEEASLAQQKIKDVSD